MPGLEMSIATANRRDVLLATVAAALGGSVVAGIFTVWSLWRTHRSPLEQAGSLPGNARCHELSQGRFFLSWIIGRFRRLSGKSVLFGKCLTSDMERVESPSQSQVESNQALGSEVKSAITHASNNRSKLDHFNPSKRQGYLSWDDYFMAIAFLSAQRSKDPNRQVGACVVSQDQIILGIGYNGFPRGCSDDKLPWAKMSEDGDPLKTKYPYVCHAEVNAILNRNHASAAGQRLFVTMFPCNECAKVIIQARIAEVVYFTEKGSFTASRRLLAMAGVKVWQYKPGTQALLLEYR